VTVRTTLSFTERHHNFILEQVDQGIYASQSAVVADAIESLIRKEQERERALQAMVAEIRRRAETPRDQFVAEKEAFGGLGLDEDDQQE
jgi:putative addiction module CopG family antidote